MDSINEQIYILFSMYYYEAFLYKDNIQVGRVIQPVSYSSKYLVDKTRKKAYAILNERAFVKGHKLILHYNADYGLPLNEIEETQLTQVNENLIKTRRVKKLIGSFTEEQIRKTNPKIITEYNFSPEMIFEMFNGTFVVKTMSKPKTTDWTYVALAGIVAVIIIALISIAVFGF
jgi:hypothetical protein